MGERKLLRWERRRRRGQSGRDARAFKSFWGFELVLIILIFSIWLIGARLIQIYAVVTSPCAEMAAAIGQSGSGPSAFDLFFWISVLTGLYWAVVSAAFWRTLWRSKSALFHSALLVCILLLMANFRMMHMDNNMPPDGTLAIKPTIVDGANGVDKYYQDFSYGDQYGSWSVKKTELPNYVYYEQWRHRCVWLDRGLITDESYGLNTKGEYLRINGYGAASIEGRIALAETARENHGGGVKQWHKGSFVKEIRAIWIGSLGKVSPLEVLRDRQMYRPLLSEERARFMTKQQCIKTHALSATQMSDCQYYWAVDWGAAQNDGFWDDQSEP